MNNYFLTILLASTIVISSCGGEKSTENTATTCFYEYEKRVAELEMATGGFHETK